jgi:hypothetical protein
MEKLADAVPAEKIEQELCNESRIAEFRRLEIHLVVGLDAPNTLNEIGRIREQEYRRVGAGRGSPVDLDSFDTEWPAYHQLVSWDPEERQIVAAYRAIRCDWALRHGGVEALRTNRLFAFSDDFVRDYLSRSVELGRSVVNADAKKAVSGLFSVWVGLGAMVREWAEVRFFFGNVSLYRSMPERAVRSVCAYLLRHHRLNDELVRARRPVDWVQSLLEESVGGVGPTSFEELQALAANEGWPVPPILVSYAKAHPGMIAFDVAEDDDFGGAYEVAIAIPVEGLSERTVGRFVAPYQSVNRGRFVLPENAVRSTNQDDR